MSSPRTAGASRCFSPRSALACYAPDSTLDLSFTAQAPPLTTFTELDHAIDAHLRRPNSLHDTFLTVPYTFDPSSTASTAQELPQQLLKPVAMRVKILHESIVEDPFRGLRDPPPVRIPRFDRYIGP
jgi:hypothetical protein